VLSVEDLDLVVVTLPQRGKVTLVPVEQVFQVALVPAELGDEVVSVAKLGF
jgi:hypothetical protein